MMHISPVLRNTGEKKRWNFDKYVQVHISQFTTLQSLKQYGYKGIDDRTRVRFLMAGIKMRELDPVTTRIMSSLELKVDFDGCVNLYRDYIQSQPGQCGVNQTLNIAPMLPIENIPSLQQSLGCGPWSQAHMCLVVLGGFVVVGVAWPGRRAWSSDRGGGDGWSPRTEDCGLRAVLSCLGWER